MLTFGIILIIFGIVGVILLLLVAFFELQHTFKNKKLNRRNRRAFRGE